MTAADRTALQADRQAGAPDGGGRRSPGRPPDLAKREAIIEAALEVLAEVGYASMTIDAVAQRAGSNRVLIYRVWDSKLALARDALFGTADALVVPDTGSTYADLEDFVSQLVGNMNRPAYLKGVPGLTVELMNEPVLFREAHRRYVEPTERGFATILERGRARGEVRGDVDPRVLTRVVSGTVTSLAQAGRHSSAAITEIVMALLVGGLIPLSDARK